ncbi:RNA polymerase sigma factor [Spirosoma soli]|uniref:RNA polymerase sigma factor n=1 Tax=Spirosoma soli TaxID=1770529 RepID=A0ABW5M7Y7_9BACT
MKNYFTDEELVNQYQETRQNDYFEQLYERYCDKVHRKCMSFTKDSMQADDLTQDIFLRLINKIDGYKHQAKFSTWLYSITYNYCTDQVRAPRSRKETLLGEGWEGLNINADDGLSEREELAARQVQKAMMRLAPEDQSLLRQKYQDDLSVRDLAYSHSLTESAVKMRLKRSRDRLRQYYQEQMADY